MTTENLSTLKIHSLTQEQYERALAAGQIDETAIYLTPYSGNENDGSINSDEFLKKTGDWMIGPFGLTEDVGYGINLPVDGEEGQVFFLQDDSSSNNIPTPTEEDNGKFLRVINGQPKWVSIPIAESSSF